MEKIKPEAIRISLGMNQKEFAAALGLSVRTYHYRVTGRTNWKICELSIMSEISGIPLDNIDFH